MTPKSKKESKLKLQESLTDMPSGTNNKLLQREIGLNLSKQYESESVEKKSIEEKVKEFFNRDDVSRIAPDTRKTVPDPDYSSKKVQIRYRLGYLKTVYYKFVAESNNDCCYETFTRHVPCYVKKATASDWGHVFVQLV